MTDAIFEGGVLRPLSPLDLAEHDRVRLIVESARPAAAENPDYSDPLADLICDMGIADLSENFDDYRFGRKKP